MILNRIKIAQIFLGIIFSLVILYALQISNRQKPNTINIEYFLSH